jgi:hypothetical protein
VPDCELSTSPVTRMSFTSAPVSPSACLLSSTYWTAMSDASADAPDAAVDAAARTTSAHAATKVGRLMALPPWTCVRARASSGKRARLSSFGAGSLSGFRLPQPGEPARQERSDPSDLMRARDAHPGRTRPRGRSDRRFGPGCDGGERKGFPRACLRRPVTGGGGRVQALRTRSRDGLGRRDQDDRSGTRGTSWCVPVADRRLDGRAVSFLGDPRRRREPWQPNDGGPGLHHVHANLLRGTATSAVA